MFNKFLKIGQIFLGLFYKNTILSGPFKGFSISKNYFGSSYLPKVLGTYELEIAEQLYIAFKMKDVFIDVGCAGGFYLQLAGQINSKIELHGFDINQSALDHVKKTLPTANLHNEEFNSQSIERIDKLVNNRNSVILIDIEGYEWSFLESLINLVISSKNILLFVELHNYDNRAYILPKVILDKVRIIDYRFKNGVPYQKLLTENEFRDLSTQYLICQGNV